MKCLALLVMWTGCVPPGQPPYGYNAQPPPPAGQAGGTGGCLDVTRCYGTCRGLAPECTNACDATGTPAASAANLELFRCINANQCADEACITSQCAAPLQTCTATPGVQLAQSGPPGAPQPQPPVQQPPPAPPPGELQTAPNLPAIADAEFVFHGQNGLDYVPELRVVAKGVPVSLDGLWSDTKHNFTIELHADTYVVTFAQSSAYFQAGTTTTERGTWSLADTTFTMTPSETHLAATSKLHGTSQTSPNDPPRTWTLVGATLAFEKFGDATHATYRVDGLVLSGTSPSWDAVGAFAHTVRRTR